MTFVGGALDQASFVSTGFRADPIGRIAAGVLAVTIALFSQTAVADESGVSFWLPGTFGSLAAVPVQPGLSAAMIYYHTSVSAGGNVAAAREVELGAFRTTVNVSLNANLNSAADLLVLAPSYTFATPVLGGQAAVSLTGIYGRVNTSIVGTLLAGVGASPFSGPGKLAIC